MEALKYSVTKHVTTIFVEGADVLVDDVTLVDPEEVEAEQQQQQFVPQRTRRAKVFAALRGESGNTVAAGEPPAERRRHRLLPDAEPWWQRTLRTLLLTIIFAETVCVCVCVCVCVNVLILCDMVCFALMHSSTGNR